MSYQVIARKYRPQTFDEVVGQNAAAQTLRNAILQNRIAHAYLFAGARGVGKTSTARILAKALNCKQGPTVTPCNECPSCVEITAGNSIDVLEIDAASNRGIDEIRELRENVKYAAARDRYKVFIIDEVHMLTTEAFNALLKTLEEPPPQVTFILATTELHKVPSTILSRCQHFNFRAISYHEVLGQLKKIADEEHIQISDEALNAIARASEGSMRDAQSQLDQIIAFCGNEVKDEQVRDLLGIVPQQLLDDLTSAIVQQDARKVLVLIDQLVASGMNLQHFVREMLGHFRNLLLLKIVGDDSKLIPLAPAEMGRAGDLAAHFSEEDLTRFFQILVTAEGEMRWSSQPRFHLEMALTRVLHAKRLVSIEKLINQLGGAEPPSSPEPPAKGSTQLPQSPATSRFTAAAPARALAETPASPAAARAGVVESLKATVAQRSPLVSSLLEHAYDIRQTSRGIEIEFAVQDRFSLEMLQSVENFNLLQEISNSVAGRPQPVKVFLESGSGGETPRSAQVVAPDGKKELLERVKADASVRSFIETFHGEITDVKDLK
ncbi:MAG: DNA polymerase III subunit gamma/tau [Acidobacteria bacterium]|nr:DNA polymerase III subunit gamma/tau [Acidobacteriota bacterium]